MKISTITVDGLNIRSIRKKDDGGHTGSAAAWQLIALYEILVELRKLNTLLHCHNFVDIPHKLERIAKNTTKPKRRRIEAEPVYALIRKALRELNTEGAADTGALLEALAALLPEEEP